MTRIHSKLTGATTPAPLYPPHRGAHDQCAIAPARCPDGWIRSDDVLDDNTVWPWAESAALSERRKADQHRARNAFILQQDPDGCWHLDRWSDNTAGTIRLDAGAKHPARASLPPHDCGVCFIIEIG